MRNLAFFQILICLIVHAPVRAETPAECETLFARHLTQGTANFQAWPALPVYLRNSARATIHVRVDSSDANLPIRAVDPQSDLPFTQSPPYLNLNYQGAQHMIVHGAVHRLLDFHDRMLRRYDPAALAFEPFIAEQNPRAAYPAPKAFAWYGESWLPPIDLAAHKNGVELQSTITRTTTYVLPKVLDPALNEGVFRILGLETIPGPDGNLGQWLMQNDTKLRRQHVVADLGAAYLFSRPAFRELGRVPTISAAKLQLSHTAAPDFMGALGACFYGGCAVPVLQPPPPPPKPVYSPDLMLAFNFINRHTSVYVPTEENDLLDVVYAMEALINQITPESRRIEQFGWIQKAMDRCRPTDDPQGCFVEATFALMWKEFRTRPGAAEAEATKSLSAMVEVMNQNIESVREAVLNPPVSEPAPVPEVIEPSEPRTQELWIAESAESDAFYLDLPEAELKKMVAEWSGVELQGYPAQAADSDLRWTILIRRGNFANVRDEPFLALIRGGHTVEAIQQPANLERIEANFYNRAALRWNFPSFDYVFDLRNQRDAQRSTHFALHISPAITFKEMYKHGLDMTKLPELLADFEVASSQQQSDGKTIYRLVGKTPDTPESFRLVVMPDGDKGLLLISIY